MSWLSIRCRSTAEMFRLLLLEDQQVLIHCASGKDRTVVGAALILDVLGVAEEEIIEDYLLTNKYLPLEEEIVRVSSEFSDRTGSSVSEEVLRPLLEVRPEYLAACFEEIRKTLQIQGALLRNGPGSGTRRSWRS